MSKVLDLILGLAGNATTKDVTATNTPALDDATKKLATTEFLLQQFTGTGKRSLTANGYQKFPGGLILQWGVTTAVASTTTNVTLPIPYPTAILIATGNVGVPILAGPWAIGVAPLSNSVIQIQNTDTLNHGVFWFAIGS